MLEIPKRKPKRTPPPRSVSVSFRTSPEIKRTIARTAKQEGVSLSSVVERIVVDWYNRREKS